MANKILFLSTLNLATNPRLVKEIRLALKNGFEVEIICFEFDNWSKEINDSLKESLKEVKLTEIPAGRTPFLAWIFSSGSEQFFRFTSALIHLPLSLLSQAVSRRSCLLLKALKNAEKPDWVIGHNPGALYATRYAAMKFNCKAGFDVEDYHPGEGHNKLLQKITKRLMGAVLPAMDYVSFAAPLIREAVQQDMDTPLQHSLVVMNCFPDVEFRPPISISGPLRLVWFSQHIAAGRGLEVLIRVVEKLGDSVELHLFGKMDELFYRDHEEVLQNVLVHKPISQHELHKRLGEFDIGLALEPGKDRNNELAISNKMLAYLQAGLFVVASNTPAQRAFLGELPVHGKVAPLTEEGLSLLLLELYEGKEELRASRQNRYEQFPYNWEKEAARLQKIWSKNL